MMRTSSKVWALAAVCSIGVSAVPAHGAEPPPSTAETSAPAVAATDLVLLKGGGMLRGTIAELVPHDRVVIVLVTGQRRVVSMAEVEYAGPAAGAPSAAQPASAQFPAPATPAPSASEPATEGGLGLVGTAPLPTPPSTGDSDVRFESPEPGLEVYVQEWSSVATVGNWRSFTIDSYSKLCSTPCTARLKPGSHRFAVATTSGKPVPVDEAVNLGSGDYARVEYQSYSGMRVAGWLVLVGGVIGGTVLMVTSLTSEPCPQVPPGEIDTCVSQPTIKTGQLVAGGALALGGTLVGMLLILKKDEASLRVGGGPTAVRLNPMSGEMSHPGGIASSGAPGLVLSGTF